MKRRRDSLEASREKAARAAETPVARNKRLAEEGIEALEKKDFVRAKERLRECIKANPEAVTVRVYYARAQVGCGELKEAAESYKVALSYDMNNMDASKELRALEVRMGGKTPSPEAAKPRKSTMQEVILLEKLEELSAHVRQGKITERSLAEIDRRIQNILTNLQPSTSQTR